MCVIPIGTVVNHACREAGVGLQTAITVQTYHAALALAHHGHAVAVVDTCTAASADRGKVDVLALAPHIAVPIKSLRTVNRPGSLLASAMTQCMRQAVGRDAWPRWICTTCRVAYGGGAWGAQAVGTRSSATCAAVPNASVKPNVNHGRY